MEPELITIIEGPTPEFLPHTSGWVQSVFEGPEESDIALCQLRTGNGTDILDRCVLAWQEGRPVRLDYPDNLRLRQQVDVVALRLTQVEEGELLLLWVAMAVEGDNEEAEEGGDEGYDGLDGDSPF